MTTITLKINETTLSRAEQKAAALATSVDEVVAQYLEQWADGDGLDDARRRMMQRFAQPDWQFSVGQADDREQRSARA